LVRRSGVRNFTFNIDKGVGTFLPAQGKPFDYAEFQEAVKGSGFPLLWTEVSVEGRLGKVKEADGRERLSLSTAAPLQVFYLEKSEIPEEAAVYAGLTDRDGQPLRLQGRLSSSAEGKMTILVKAADESWDGD
jgi:hypothetical protein